jgi:hypothetical protein
MIRRVSFALVALVTNVSSPIGALALSSVFTFVLAISYAALAASPSGTVIPQASQIVDSAGHIWTVDVGGEIYENGIQVSGGGTTDQLLYYNGAIYAEYTIGGVNNWYSWNGSGWNNLGVNGEPQPPSASGTIVPSVPDIVDSSHNVWSATVGGQIDLNGIQVSGSGTTDLLLYYNGKIYTEYTIGGVNNWYSWNGSGWNNLGVNGDPRPPGLSIFSNFAPVNPVNTNTAATTLGVKFWSTQPGTLSAIKFYRGATSPQGYVARLYSASGTLLGSVTIAQESRPVPGWQQAVFASPLPIAANTTYVAAYYAPSGQYSDTPYGLTQTVSNGPLNAPAASLVGGNGVWKSGLAFPTGDWEHANFFVDVVFTPSVQSYLSITANPANPTIPSTTSPGSIVTNLTARWSSGSPFTGTLSFGAPNFNSGGVYALDSNNNLIISPLGPGVGSAGGSTENVTIVATQ